MQTRYTKPLVFQILFTIILTLNVQAQYRLELDTLYASNISAFLSFAELEQGRYAVAGYEVTGAPTWAYQMSLNIIDSSGNVELDTSFAGRGNEYAGDVHLLSDGNLLLVGLTGLDYFATYDIGLKKVSVAGDTLWTRRFDHGGYEAPTASIVFPNGYIAITGTQRIGDYGVEDGWVYLLDTLGQVAWMEVIGGSLEDYPRDILATPSGKIIVAGGTRSFNGTNGDGWLYALDQDGDSLWMLTYGGSKAEEFSSICMSSSGTFIVAGTKDNDLWLLETDSAGTVLNENIFGGQNTDNSLKIIPAPEGGYYLLAFTASFGSMLGDAWVIKLGADLEPLWSGVLGSPERDNIFEMALSTTGDILLGGREGTTSDAWLMRIRSEANQPPAGLELLKPAADSLLVLDDWPGPQDSLIFNWTTAIDADTLNVYPELEYLISISSSAWGDTVISVGNTQSFSLPLLPLVQAMVDSMRVQEAIEWTVRVSDSQNSVAAANGPFTLTVEAPALDVEDDLVFLPEDYLLQNFPNPFNPSTTIRYGLPEASRVSLVIYDIRGKRIQTITAGHQSAGWYDLVWNGATANGKTISTGIYFARLVAADPHFEGVHYSQVIKMLYLK